MDFNFLQYLPKEQQEKLGTEMTELLMSRALKAFHAALPKDEQAHFETLLKDGAPEAQVECIGRHGELFKKVLVDEALKLEREIDAGMAEEK